MRAASSPLLLAALRAHLNAVEIMQGRERGGQRAGSRGRERGRKREIKG